MMAHRPRRFPAAALRPLLAAAALAAAFALGWAARGARGAPDGGARSPVSRIHEQGQQWRFINPLLECDGAEELLRRPALVSFKNRLVAFVNTRRASGDVIFASVYYRELNEGPWLGVNERVGYIPASLLKLPTLIAVLKRAETDPAFLERRVVYPGGRDANQMMYFRPRETLEPGVKYTVEELCRRMVSQSDNNATGMLNALVAMPEQGRVLRGLGVDPEALEARGKLDVRSVSAFFRVLYNASYLERATSERALAMLAETSFRDGIVAGVPAGTLVASKYGEAAIGPGLVQLHEFAIVYHGSRPYLLGVMTQGREVEPLVRFIRDVSRTVHDAVDREAAAAGGLPAPGGSSAAPRAAAPRA